LDTDLIDFGKFTDEAGEPDMERIEAAVGRLAEAVPEQRKPARPVVPSGPRQDAGESDWLRTAMANGRG
jgi:hypothetical protein